MNLFQCTRMELGQYLCYQLEFLLDLFTEERSYQGLKDATSISFLSDKSAEILGSKYLKIWKFSILPQYGVFQLEVMSQPHLHMSEHEGEAPCGQYGELAIFPIFQPSYLSALIRYQTKQGGIL